MVKDSNSVTTFNVEYIFLALRAYLVKTELYFEEIWGNYFPKDGEIIYLRSTISIFYFINMLC